MDHYIFGTGGGAGGGGGGGGGGGAHGNQFFSVLLSVHLPPDNFFHVCKQFIWPFLLFQTICF